MLSKVGTTPVSQMSRVMSAKETTHGSVNHNGGEERELRCGGHGGAAPPALLTLAES